MHDVGPPPRPLPEEDTPPTTPASYRVPSRARHLPTAFVRSGPQEDWVPKRGSYHSTTATSVRGSHGQTTRGALPEVADGRKIQARDTRSRTGWSHSELTEPYGPLRRRWTMGRRGTSGCCRERKKIMTSWHKEDEEASRRRATKRDFRDLEPPTHL